MKTLKVLLQEVVSGIKAWVNSNFAQESNAVHKTGDETVNGVKTFTTDAQSNTRFVHKDTVISSKEAPSSERKTDSFSHIGSDGTFWGGLKHCWYASGISATQICVANHKLNGSTWNQGFWAINLGAYKDFSSVYFAPTDNNTINLGAPNFQWNNVYAKNYYYNGTAWGLDKNNWWSLAQFYAQNSIHVRNVEPGVAPSSDVSAGIRFENANASYVFADILGKVFSNGTTFVNLAASNKFTNGALDPNGATASRGLQVGIRNDGSGFIYTDCGWRNSLVPHSLDTNLNLGTSDNKWKTLNGINPGALSLPDFSADYDVSGEIVPPEGENAININGGSNYFTPTVSGWLSIRMHFATLLLICRSTRTSYAFKSTNSSEGDLCVCSPVVAGVTYKIIILASKWNDPGDNYDHFRLAPCLGNV